MSEQSLTLFQKLANLSIASSRKIIGLMSGTSLDGLDIALCEVRGRGVHTECTVIAFETVEYPLDVKQKIRAVFAQKSIDLEYLTLLNAWLGDYHGNLVLTSLKKWQIEPCSIDLIASHGQTIFHCPKHQHTHADFKNGTLQIGDADHIAVTTKIPTFSDFRQKHVATGGEGAPLAIYGDYCLFGDKKRTRVLLNLGGIANITVLPAGAELSDVICSDIGPANTIVDAYVSLHFNQPFDRGGEIAQQGKVNALLLAALLMHPFLAKPLPKSTGPEVFNLNWLEQAMLESSTVSLAKEDVVATLTEFSACAVVNHINMVTQQYEEVEVFASGGGVQNPVLASAIQLKLNSHVKWNTTASLGIDPDAKEAVLFAVLANEAITQTAQSSVTLTNLSMGKLSLPY